VYIKLENVAIIVVLPRAALRLNTLTLLACSLARTRSHSLELFQTRSPGAAKPFRFHSFSSCYFSNEGIFYVATKFCENILIGVGAVTAKRNSKECPLVAEFNFRFQFYTYQSSGTSTCVTVQNFSEIRLSAAELLRLNQFKLAAIRYLDFSKKSI